ncbi:MAG: 1-acyl-sn-glycerol-3-phosphate acyltransferase [Ignavibacteria bacterium]|nr:1-acyl-sn-glycerol-3-phosphate acyltransferase [Ignavibacteria bacterium]
MSVFDRKGKITHYLSKLFGGGILFIAGVKVITEGRDLLDSESNYIFISNHLSYFDIPILMKAIPNNVRFIYKDTLTKIPVLGWGMYLGGYIPINRENVREAMKSLKKAALRIINGISVVIFPEGTRSPDGITGEFKRGMFVLADEAKVSLVPTTINGSEKILPKDKFKIRSGTVRVIFSKPLKYRKEKTFLEEIRNIIVSNRMNSENK